MNKAKKILKWKPKIEFEKGIDKTINYYRKMNTGEKKI